MLHCESEDQAEGNEKKGEALSFLNSKNRDTANERS